VGSKRSDDQSIGRPVGGVSNLIGVLFLFAIVVGVMFMVVGLAPTDLPPDRGSNFIDTVFHNKGVILAARLLLVSAAVVLAVGGIFIVSSIVVRMRKGEWLRRAGPFEIGDVELSEVESGAEHWRAIANASEEEVAELTERLQTAEKLLGELKRRLSAYEGVRFE
jgi:hypothetical protein